MFLSASTNVTVAKANSTQVTSAAWDRRCNRFSGHKPSAFGHHRGSRLSARPGSSAQAARRRRGVTAHVRCLSDPNDPSFAEGYANVLLPKSIQHDFVVIGSGIAGLSYALKVAEYGTVAVVTKATANEGCTQYAQGGICAVLDKTDSVESHIQDTMVAGCFLNNPRAVDVVCREGPKYVMELIEFGAEFTRNKDGSLHLTREGGHEHRRIVHAADITGHEIERALLAACRSHPNITFFEHHLAMDLVWDEVSGMKHCLGVDVFDQRNNRMCRFVAPVTMLASGGAGQVYPNTTNPAVSTGDGMAMAYRAKAVMANMEFVQFHPTGLFDSARHHDGRTFLISEAVRGEGGMLFNAAGERFMSRYDDRLELAPRDVVARSIYDQMVARGDQHVYLDISHMPSHQVLHHFPNIAANCATMGIDITRDPIPVVPTQHYMCGGVQTGLLGETSIPGLYACGEVACTGLHGANRLASNSLLEGLVMANRAVSSSVAHADHVQRTSSHVLSKAALAAQFGEAREPTPPPTAVADWVAGKRATVRDILWEAAGIVRSTKTMRESLRSLAEIYVEVKAMYSAYGVSTPMAELRNLVTVGELIVSSAMQRKESRGLHYSQDHPAAASDQCRETVIKASFKKRYDLSQVVARVKPQLFVAGPGMKGDKRARSREMTLRSKNDQA